MLLDFITQPFEIGFCIAFQDLNHFAETKKILMKKFIYFHLLLSLSIFAEVLCGQSLAFSFSQSPVCYTPGNTSVTVLVTSYPMGATSYSWHVIGNTSCGPTFTNNAVGDTTSISLGTCCGVYSVTCYAYNSTTLVASIMATTSVICPSWLTINTAPNFGSLCAGQQGTITLGGGTTYTWVGTGSNLNVQVSTPTISTCYSVIAKNSAGCVINTTACFSVFPTPVLSITGNTAICAGATTTLAAFGSASTYTWYPGAITSSSIIVSPSSSTCYTLVGANNTGCASMTTACVIVNPLPTLSITPSGTMCLGSGFTLTTFGANSYTWNTGSTTATMVVTPTASTCYSVIGMNANGCTNMAASCITVVPGPAINIAGTQSVCSGTSATFTVTGGTNYLWSNNATTNTLNVIPTVSNNSYSVTSTGSNGCTGSATISVGVYTTCSDVWPGDANSDGIVSSTDVLELGLAANSTGAARNPGGNSYIGQYATNWSGTVSSGKNKCHADCNGDGTVNASDTGAIYNNFNLAHSFKSSGSFSSDPDITIVYPSVYVNPGSWYSADIVLGSSTNPASQVYGITFEVNFDLSMIDNNNVYLVYTPSFFNASNQNIIFRKINLSTGKIYAATVRTDGSNVSGNGKIGELFFKVKSGLTDNTMIDFSITNSTKINKDGVQSALTTGSVSATVNNNLAGLITNDLSANTGIFPNPSKGEFKLFSREHGEISYSVIDLTGREVANGSFIKTGDINLSELSNGTYFIRLQNENGIAVKKLMVEK